MKLRLTESGLAHYSPRTATRRANAIGTVLSTLPGQDGTIAVEWPWGIAFNYPSEVEVLA